MFEVVTQILGQVPAGTPDLDENRPAGQRAEQADKDSS